MKSYYKNRVPELDLLRGMAILMVLLRHYPLVDGFKQLWIGVDVFFTLSGFLVAGILIREYQERGKVNIGKFLIRRGLKIYPSFYIFLFLTVGMAWIFKMAGKPILFPVLDMNKFLNEVVYLQSLTKGLWWHTWSLAVEEHFYFILAFLVLILSRGTHMIHRLLLLSIVCLPICIALRLENAVQHSEFSYVLHYNNTFLRLDSLFFGVLLSCVYYQYQEALKKWPKWLWMALQVAGIAALIGWLTHHPLESIATAKWGFTVVYVGFGAILFGLMGLRLSTGMASSRVIEGNTMLSWIMVLGRNSYNIYLWHAIALEGMILLVYSLMGISVFEPMNSYFFAIYLTASIALGFGMTHLLEIPILRWRDRKYTGAGKISAESKT